MMSGRPRDRGALASLRTFLRQWAAQRRHKARSASIRSTDLPTVGRAYGSMTPGEFEAVNGPQDWLNHRMIPRALATIDRPRPWRVVDLGCGTGGSTRILAHCAPPASTLVGYELCQTLVAEARVRTAHEANGKAHAIEFVCQSMLEPLQDPRGGRLTDRSVDVAHAAGVIGHHLRESDVRVLATELDRVLTDDGIAILDAGPNMPPRRLTRLMRQMGFERIACERLLPFASRAALVFRRRDRR